MSHYPLADDTASYGSAPPPHSFLRDGLFSANSISNQHQYDVNNIDTYYEEEQKEKRQAELKEEDEYSEQHEHIEYEEKSRDDEDDKYQQPSIKTPSSSPQPRGSPLKAASSIQSQQQQPSGHPSAYISPPKHPLSLKNKPAEERQHTIQKLLAQSSFTSVSSPEYEISVGSSIRSDREHEPSTSSLKHQAVPELSAIKFTKENIDTATPAVAARSSLTTQIIQRAQGDLPVEHRRQRNQRYAQGADRGRLNATVYIPVNESESETQTAVLHRIIIT